MQHVEINEKGWQRHCPPLFVKLDVESDLTCDSQPVLNTDFEAGEDDEVMGKNRWKDHPVQQQMIESYSKPTQALPVLAKPPEGVISPEEDTSKSGFNVDSGLG